MYMYRDDVENSDEVLCDCGFRHSMWSRCPDDELCRKCCLELLGDDGVWRQKLCTFCHLGDVEHTDEADVLGGERNTQAMLAEVDAARLADLQRRQRGLAHDIADFFVTIKKTYGNDGEALTIASDGAALVRTKATGRRW